MKITPILFVERIEPSLPLWIERLGFEKTVEVPEGDHLGFAILMKAGTEVMLQTYASLEQDFKTQPDIGRGSCSLYIEVDDFDYIRRRLEGSDVVVPERVTFYGMREIAIREPGGHLLCFAAKAESPQ